MNRKLSAYLALPLAIGAVSPVAATQLSIGEWGAIKYGIGALATACVSEADLGRYRELRGSDIFAADAFAQHHCATIDGGVEVMVEHGTWEGDALCVRPRGATDCLWMQNLAVESKADADNEAAARKERDAEAATFNAKQKVFDEDFDQRWYKAHPECRPGRTKKRLPDICN
jgi:hypothetical protein